MAPLLYFSPTKVLVFILFTSIIIFVSSETQPQSKKILLRRRMLAIEDENEDKPQKKPIISNLTKNHTELIKSKSQTTSTPPKFKSSSKNDTKLKNPATIITNVELKKLNIGNFPKNQNPVSEPSNSIKSNPIITKKTSNSPQQKTSKTPQNPSWIEQDDDDFITEFRDFTNLPTKFQQTLIPDLEIFSTTSKAYLTKANIEITEGFKPIVGTKYASTIACLISIAFIIIPLLFVSLIVKRIKAYFSLQKLLIFIQFYLSIYFSILCFSALVTGLEPLRFFYATSRSTYICLQVLQMLGYVMYLLLLCMYLVLVFSTDCGLGSRVLGLGQTFIGLAIGLHSYMSVFHRVVLHQPPKTSWQVHGLYATCYLVICLFATADRRKKAYLEEGGEEGKKN